MVNMDNENSLMDHEVGTPSIDSGSKLVGAKSFLIGAAVVGGIWGLTSLYKKLKKQKPKEVNPEETVNEVE